MQSGQRAIVRTVRRLRPQAQRQQRRFESHDAHSANADHHTASANESFGAGFYISLLAIPAALGLYKISRPGENGEAPYFTRIIRDAFALDAISWENRNDTHTKMIEQAAADRALFLNEPTQTNRHISLKFPEILNTGSPWNVPAGHYANMDTLIEKYRKEAFEENDRKLQQLRENKVPAEQPLPPLAKTTPAAKDS